ncbi:hypothetical protein LY90DRAFT_636981, partial [Neocallimastix californiae]
GYLKFHLFLFLIYLLKKAYLYNISINNDVKTMENLADIINDPLLTNDVNVNLFNENYNIDCNGKNHLYLHNSLTFNGKNNTKINFQSSDKGSFKIHFSAGSYNKKLIFNNINFYNYDGTYVENSGIVVGETEEKIDQYTIEFNNCEFYDIKAMIINIKITCLKKTQSLPQVIFNNCKFKNLNEVFQAYHFESFRNSINQEHCFSMEYRNCYFENIKTIGELYYGDLAIYDSYITNIYGSEEFTCSFIHSSAYNNKITIKNTKIIDNFVTLNKPFFVLLGSFLELENSIFKNCYSYSNYLMQFFGRDWTSLDNPNMIISNTEFNNINTLVEGVCNSIKITDSKFHNITSRSSTPIIFNSSTSTIHAENTEFSNIISLRSSLFSAESSLIFSNVKFNNIMSNSFSLIACNIYKSSFSNCSFESIICNGESENSSLLEFKSPTYGAELEFNDVIIRNCKSNGNLINVKGNLTTLKFSHLTLNNNDSYGPLINNESIKSFITFDNLNIYNNKNINKFKCGLFTYNKNINLTITNSIFKDNIIKNNGGSLCFTDIDSLNMKIKSSLFENNYGINGGVMYFKQFNNHLNENPIELIDLIFKKNKAEYFGGVIFSDNEHLNIQNVKNVTFTENYAYAGGVIYLNNENNEIIKNDLLYVNNKNFIYINNTAESHGDNYATDPYVIDLINQDIYNIFNRTIKSGDSIPLKFNLYDEFNQTINDASKLYSNLGLKINILNNNDSNNYKLYGNSCFYSNGICDLTNFKIFSINPNNIKLNISIVNENNKILFKNEIMNVEIAKCDEEQIKITDKYNYYSCEKPICKENCPILKGTAECIKGNKENVNSIELNQCKCLPGWLETNCDKRDLTKFNNLNKRIIEDTGFIKCELVLFGLLLSLISLNFNPFENYNSCALEFIFKHSGIILIYIIFTLYTQAASKLGLNLQNYNGTSTLQLSEPYKENSFIQSSKNYGNLEIISSSNRNVKFDGNTSKMQVNTINSQNIANKNDSMSINKSEMDSKKLYKNISFIHSLTLELCIAYIILSIALIIIILILKRKDIIYVQQYNYTWSYECPLRSLNLGIFSFESLLILFLVINSKNILNYTYIFKCTRYIIYAGMIWITFGPLIDLISYLAKYDNSNVILGFSITTNSICYFIIFILFIWDKVYYILRHQDNNCHNYFLAVKLEKCFIHNSFNCKCNKKQVEENDENIKQYIQFYKYNTQIFTFSNGRIIYNRSKNAL